MKYTERFPIGFWNYPSVTEHPPEEVKVWADCGITHNMTPGFSYADNDPEMLIAFLDEAEKYGMKMIVTIRELYYPNAAGEEGKKTYRETFRRAYADFGKHPVVTGFSIGDEPRTEEQNQACANAYSVMQEIAPELTPFLNFLPYSDWFEREICHNVPRKQWIQNFKAQTGCKMICYDCYAQLLPEDFGREMYFNNLLAYSEMAEAANIPFWTTLLSVGHFRYRVPTEDDLRWQLNTAVASGAKGILWFLFYNSLNNNNYRLSPIDEFGDKTETYARMSRVNRVFDAMHGRMLFPMKFKGAYHFGRTFGGWKSFYDLHHPLIRYVTGNKTPGILSFFEDADGKEYTLITSNSPFDSDIFYITLESGTRVIRHGMNGEQSVDFAKFNHDAAYEVHSDNIRCGFFLAPGQMELLELLPPEK